ncbi:MAG: TetR/AcrR family transcriptional regulator [Gammaproteobacteria bacterium]|nr:TetR/AcrR family transcriptional regulator [Gammaproteobacteria bacterium]
METIFLREGFRGLTIDSLAKRLRCSNRTLYEIAPSKEEMFLVVLDRWLERIRHLGQEGAMAQSDPIKRVEAFLEPGVTETREASAAFVEDVRFYLPAKQMLGRHQEERMKVLESMVSEGIRQGSFREVHAYLVSEVLLSAVTRIDEIDFQSRAGLTFSEAFGELYDLFLHGLVIND